jgi:hypothetical protein
MSEETSRMELGKMRAVNLLGWLGQYSVVLLMLVVSDSSYAQSYPRCTGTGEVASDAQGTYWALDGKCGGFDFFAKFNADFPAIVSPCAGSVNAHHECLDMAYAKNGSLSWLNVKVPSSGRYQLDFRYAFAKGLFPLDCERPEALVVNGVKVINTVHFMRTSSYSFSVFEHKLVVVNLNAGVNSVEMYNNGSDHGISRLDYVHVTPTPNPPTPVDGGATPNCLYP